MARTIEIPSATRKHVAAALSDALNGMWRVYSDNGKLQCDAWKPEHKERFDIMVEMLKTATRRDDDTIVCVYAGRQRALVGHLELKTACEIYGDTAEHAAKLREEIITTGSAKLRTRGTVHHIVAEG
jgi:hypothetical protein